MDKVEFMLKNYSALKEELQKVRFELENFQTLTESEVIESLVFSQHFGERVKCSNTSNRSEDISLSFREKLDRENAEIYQTLSRKNFLLATNLNVFEHAIRSVSEDLKEFVQDLLNPKLTWEKIEVKHHISHSTVRNWRNRALKQLRTAYDMVRRPLEISEEEMTLMLH